MIRITLLVLAMLAASMSFAAVNIGSVMAGPTEWRWVDIVNPNGINNGNGHFAFGELAGIEGGVITVVALDGDRVLCQYTAKELAYGTCCPTGALFFLNKVECQQMLAKFEQEVREHRTYLERLRAAKEHVEALLRKNNK